MRNGSTSNASRLELLDSVRGFALMGLFLVHSVEMYETFWSHPDYGPVYQWTFGLFSGKAYALMALCFGVSFYLIMQGAARRGHDFRWRFAWRLTTLFGIGLLHTIFYRGDILQMLALFGFLMLVLDRIRNNRVLLVLAAICFLEAPLLLRAWLAAKGVGWAAAQPLYFNDPGMAALLHGTFLEVVRANFRAALVMNWSYAVESGRLIQMVGLFIVGLVLARVGFFADPDRFKLQRRAVLVAAILLAVPLYFYGSDTVNSLVPDGPVRQNLGAVVDKWTALAITATELLLFVELFQSIARPLATRVCDSRPDDANALCRPISRLLPDLLRLRAGPQRGSHSGPVARDRGRGRHCAGYPRASVVPALLLRPARMAVACCDAHQLRRAVSQNGGARARLTWEREGDFGGLCR